MLEVLTISMGFALAACVAIAAVFYGALIWHAISRAANEKEAV
jgi:hypothetical protein